MKFNRSVWGWAMYDFANSAYTTTILAVMFSVYFVQVVVPAEGARIWGGTVDGPSLWGYLHSAIMATVIILGPGLGALADRLNQKRKQLIFWAVTGSIGTMALFYVRAGDVWMGVMIVFGATLAYELSLVFSNAFLKDVARDEETGLVSGFGFALGYIGGGVCLGLNMAMVAQPSWFGLQSADPTFAVRAAFLSVGVWWLVFSIPTFMWVRDPVRAPVSPPSRWSDPFKDTFRQLKATLGEIWRETNTRRFLISFFIYNDGIQTIILMAAIFGAKALGMSTVQLGLCYLMIQFVAFVGAMVFGRLADRWSHKKVVLITLAVYAAVSVWGVFMKSQVEFWILGFVIGLILGGSQAASRSMFALMTPAEKSGEYFALFSVVGKASALMGPFVFGVTNQFFGLRFAVGSLFFFFVVGGAILWGVREQNAKDGDVR